MTGIAPATRLPAPLPTTIVHNNHSPSPILFLTMKVVITGGGGFLGQVLAKEILTIRELRSGSTRENVVELVIADIAEPKEYLFDLHSLAKSSNVNLRVQAGDVSDMAYCKALIGRPEKDGSDALSVFHLGAVSEY